MDLIPLPIQLSEADTRLLEQLLENPPAPNEALLRASEHRKRMIQDSDRLGPPTQTDR